MDIEVVLDSSMNPLAQMHIVQMLINCLYEGISLHTSLELEEKSFEEIEAFAKAQFSVSKTVIVILSYKNTRMTLEVSDKQGTVKLLSDDPPSLSFMADVIFKVLDNIAIDTLTSKNEKYSIIHNNHYA